MTIPIPTDKYDHVYNMGNMLVMNQFSLFLLLDKPLCLVTEDNPSYRVSGIENMHIVLL